MAIEEKQLSWLGDIYKVEDERVSKNHNTSEKVGRPRLTWDEQDRQATENQIETNKWWTNTYSR